MATFKHPDLPGQLASGYSEDAAATLAASGWVDINAPESPDVELESAPGAEPAAEPEVDLGVPSDEDEPTS